MNRNDGAPVGAPRKPQQPPGWPLGRARALLRANPGLTLWGPIEGPALVTDVRLFVSTDLVHVRWIYHPTLQHAFIVSPGFYVDLRAELISTSLTGRPGYCEDALYRAAAAIGWTA
jgi:hypothetical protein